MAGLQICCAMLGPQAMSLFVKQLFRWSSVYPTSSFEWSISNMIEHHNIVAMDSMGHNDLSLSMAAVLATSSEIGQLSAGCMWTSWQQLPWAQSSHNGRQDRRILFSWLTENLTWRTCGASQQSEAIHVCNFEVSLHPEFHVTFWLLKRIWKPYLPIFQGLV